MIPWNVLRQLVHKVVTILRGVLTLICEIPLIVWGAMVRKLLLIVIWVKRYRIFSFRYLIALLSEYWILDLSPEGNDVVFMFLLLFWNHIVRSHVTHVSWVASWLVLCLLVNHIGKIWRIPPCLLTICIEVRVVILRCKLEIPYIILDITISRGRLILRIDYVNVVFQIFIKIHLNFYCFNTTY